MASFIMDNICDFAENAKKGRQTREFISNVRCMVPSNDDKRAALESIGFNSLQHFIYDSEGLGIDGETFVNLAFAYFCYRKKAWETIKHLVTVEGWSELLDYVPDSYLVECGGKLSSHGGDRKSEEAPTTRAKPNTKQHLILRLERDSASDPEVNAIYNQVKNGELTANRAAIVLGWRQPSITVKKDVDSAVKSLKRLFDADELKQLVDGLTA